MNTHYLTCAETAKLIRQALAKSFPATKFSVRSKTYSGGASINVGWTDGPTTKLVEAVTGQFEGRRFDGMIDMAIGVKHWLMPDGTIAIASNPGTEGSMGTIPAQREWMPSPDAKLVSFGSNYVFTSRIYSERFIRHACARLARNGYRQFADVTITPATPYSSAWIKNNWDRVEGDQAPSCRDLNQVLHIECGRLVVA